MHEIHYPTECINETEKYVITYKASFAESNPYYKAPNVFQLLEHKLNGYNLVSLSGNKQHIESILNDMHEAYHKHSNYSMIYLQAHLTLLLTSLAEYIDTWTISDINTNCENLKIKQIISYIDERINTELSLDEISHYLNMNKYHLCRFFKKNTGLSLFNYIIRRRIINSEKLIMLNKHSITDICFMTGFNSLTHFERTFRQFTGISPRNYKKGITKEALIP
jgi:AraC-like DNA-binding protein